MLRTDECGRTDRWLCNACTNEGVTLVSVLVFLTLYSALYTNVKRLLFRQCTDGAQSVLE
jgi:hypothetical protein